jgi:RND family efflux transporter MFP subunit
MNVQHQLRKNARMAAAKPYLPLFLGVLLMGAVFPVCAAEESNILAGRLAWADESRLSTPVSGVVTEILVQPGQEVKKGAVLLRLDHRPYSDRLAAATATHAGLVRAAAETKRDAERTQQLYDRTVASESERQEALIKQEQAQGSLNTAKAKMRLRRWELSRTKLTAPYPARILSIDTAVGETVSSELNEQILMRIARADQMLAEASAPPSAAARLSLGQKLNVLVGQTHIQGQLVGIVSEPRKDQEGVVSYRLEVQIKPDKDWIAGLPAKIELPKSS